MKITPENLCDNGFLTIIAAISKDGYIGKDNKIPWHIPEDLKFFKSVTLNHPVIMGRKTFNSIGKPLPRRQNIIVTQTLIDVPPNCIIANSFEGALSVAFTLDLNPFVIGGAELYQLALASSCTKEMYLTDVDQTVGQGVKFPNFDRSEWKLADEPLKLTDQATVSKFVR